MALLSSALTSFIVAASITTLPLIIRRKTKFVKAQTKESGEKYIDYPNAFFWFIYSGSTFFCIVGVLVYLFSDEPIVGLFFSGAAVAFILVSMLLHLADTTVNWTSEYICGPKSGVSLKRNCIFWKDIEYVKYLANNNIRITDNLGNSVFWSALQNGWHEIIDDLRLFRPDIDTSDFDGLS